MNTSPRISIRTNLVASVLAGDRNQAISCVKCNDPGTFHVIIVEASSNSLLSCIQR